MLLTSLPLGIETDLATMQATLADLKAAAETLQSEAQLLQTASTHRSSLSDEELDLYILPEDTHRMLQIDEGSGIKKKPTLALADDVAALLDAQEELEVLLPMRKYAEAVAAIEKSTPWPYFSFLLIRNAVRVLLKQKPALAVDSVTRRLEEHVASLSAQLIAELRLPLLRSTATERLVSYLTQLGMQVQH